MRNFKNSTLVMLFLAAVLMAGCKKETESENTENNENTENTETVGHKNPNPAQDTPISENFLSEFRCVYHLYPNTDGSFYALADGEYTDYLLRLDNNGYVQQRIELGFRSSRCIIKMGENIILIGGLGGTSSPYSMYEQGYVAVYDRNLQVVAATIIKESQYKIDLYTIVQDSTDPTLFYAGGMAIDDSYIQYPYLCTLQLSEGLMTKVSSKVYSDYAKYRIVGMVEKQSAGQKDLILEAIRYIKIDNPYNNNSCTVHIVKLNYFEEASGWGYDTWDLAVAGAHGDSYSKSNSVDSDENNIYFFGFCCDDKEPAPSGGSYWDSGLVAAVNWHQGQIVWTKTVSLTNKDEHFYNGFLSGGYFYVCGNHSGLHYLNTKKWFSNGLVAKLSLSGELVAYKTFGDSERNSHLHQIVKDSKGNMICVGESDENIGDDKLKYCGWFMKTDMSLSNSQKQAPEMKPEFSDDLQYDKGTESMCVPNRL